MTDQLVKINGRTWPRMGAVVTVYQVLERRHRGYGGTSDRKPASTWEVALIKPRAGWVTGYRWLQNGRTVYAGDPEDGYGRSWEETGPRTPAVMVAFWHDRNPVPVPLDSWEFGGEPVDDKMSESDRKFYASSMRNLFATHPLPRDARGRFVPC